MSSKKTVRFSEDKNTIAYVGNDYIHKLARQNIYWKREREFRRYCVLTEERKVIERSCMKK